MPLYNFKHPKEGNSVSAENKTLVRRWFKEVWSKGNLAVADQIVAANYANHDPASPMPEPGREGLKKHVTTYRTALPDLTITVDEALAEGNKVTVRWTARGTHKATLMGIAPTGKQVTLTGISVIRISGGKVAEHWVTWDTLGMMQQLGAVPPLGQATEQAASATR
jgi:steroid delta-isomerase-like uncharacterized protein